MKKNICIVLSVIIILGLLGGCSNFNYGQGDNVNKEIVYEEIVDKIIRFHVIANSDSEEDQNLKLKVRDAILKYMSDKLTEVKSIEESRALLLSNKDNIESIAKDVINQNGYEYGVESKLSRENFPDKYYGDMLFPQGEYEAFRVLIGDAKGKNWWCVMFPPLCLVDETVEKINYNKTKEKFEDISKGEGEESNKEEEQGIKFKFKILDIFKK